MSSEMRWRINIRNLVTWISIGIHPHEHTPQRVIVNAAVEGMYPLRPKSIEECFSYEHVHTLVVHEWPKQKHTSLLETRLVDLLEHIFRIDERVLYAKVSLCKPDIFAEADAVGV